MKHNCLFSFPCELEKWIEVTKPGIMYKPGKRSLLNVPLRRNPEEKNQDHGSRYGYVKLTGGYCGEIQKLIPRLHSLRKRANGEVFVEGRNTSIISQNCKQRSGISVRA